MEIYELKSSRLLVYPNGKFTVCPKSSFDYISKKAPNDRGNFELNISGGDRLTLKALHYKGSEKNGNTVTLYYDCERYKLIVTAELKIIPDTDVVTATCRVENYGSETVKLTRLSSAFIEDIADFEGSKWYENADISVDICHSKWQGEGQWRSYSPTDIGLYPTSIHQSERESFKISSVGSWSTSSFYPLVIVEDKAHNASWFFETEGSHNWFIKIAAYGGYSGSGLSLEASSCDEVYGWYYDLEPFKAYIVERAFFGVTDGNFEAAAAELNAFKRLDSTVSLNGKMPVVFNDYMNCIWSQQEPRLLYPLIDKAAELGAEVFCVDGGWCENKNGGGLGDWYPKVGFYGDGGLKKIADYIKQKGMIPGIWTELETCSSTADGMNICPDAVLKRYGKDIGWKRTYNFAKKEVREYLYGRLAELYEMGFRFIKNDYNHSIGIGAENNCDGPNAQGSIVNADMFYEFVDGIYERFPELIIENCGSGALRCDNKMLRRFSLQSTSDQELYFNNPSIVMGSMALMPPEKAGIWSYPYPAVYPYDENWNYIEFPDDADYKAKMADGCQTAFNMVTAMTGYLYLSGRIDKCDTLNSELVKRGVELYKSIRSLIPKSRPVYPLRMLKIGEKKASALGLLSENTLLLSVWNLSKDEKQIEIPLDGYIGKTASLETAYPDMSNCSLTSDTAILTLKPNEAKYLVIKY